MSTKKRSLFKEVESPAGQILMKHLALKPDLCICVSMKDEQIMCEVSNALQLEDLLLMERILRIQMDEIVRRQAVVGADGEAL